MSGQDNENIKVSWSFRGRSVSYHTGHRGRSNVGDGRRERGQFDGEKGRQAGKISPDGPFRLWTAINRVLPEYALSKGGKYLRSQVAGLSAGRFEGKSPGNVVAQAAEFCDVMDTLRGQLRLANIKTYKDPLGRKVTPGVVS